METGIRAATITGFALLGHGSEMAERAGVQPVALGLPFWQRRGSIRGPIFQSQAGTKCPAAGWACPGA